MITSDIKRKIAELKLKRRKLERLNRAIQPQSLTKLKMLRDDLHKTFLIKMQELSKAQETLHYGRTFEENEIMLASYRQALLEISPKQKPDEIA